MPVDAEGYYPAYTSKPYNCYTVIKDGKTYWAEFNKIDDYTFTVTFAAPKPNFPEAVAVDNKWMFLPKHFYKNYVVRKDGVTDDPTFPLITEEEASQTPTETLACGGQLLHHEQKHRILPLGLCHSAPEFHCCKEQLNRKEVMNCPQSIFLESG